MAVKYYTHIEGDLFITRAVKGFHIVEHATKKRPDALQTFCIRGFLYDWLNDLEKEHAEFYPG